MKKYLSAIKKDLCSVCVDSNDNGKCTLSDDELCAIELYLPQIVEVIHSAEQDDYDYLYKELKDKICSNCNAKENDKCSISSHANCSLDRYFVPIIDIVKKVDKLNS